MANLQPQPTTDRYATDLLDEEDERERVLLVVVRAVGDRNRDRNGDGTGFSAGSESQKNGTGFSAGSESGLLGSESGNDTIGNDSVIRADSAFGTYAMKVSAVREVIRARAVTRVPGTPRFMSGLVNVRGMVVTVLDLAECLAGDGAEVGNAHSSPSADGVTEPRAQTTGSIVLLEHGGRLVGLAVHGVRDVRPLDDAELVSDQSVLASRLMSESAGIKRGLASAGGEVVTLLDVAALLSRHLISSGET